MNRYYILSTMMLSFVCAYVPSGRAQTLAEALDATNLVWTTGGNGSWFAQTTNTHDGVDAAQSPTISSNQTSWIETTVIGPATVEFWMQTFASASPAGQANFTFNGDVWAFPWYSSPTWTMSTFDLGSGTNVFRWSLSTFSDTPVAGLVRLDEFKVSAPRPLTISFFGYDQTIYSGEFAMMSVGASGTPPIEYQWRKDGINITAATNAYLYIDAATTNHAGSYSVVVSNPQWSVIGSNIVLTVLPPSAPFFTYEPVSLSAYVGQSLSLAGSVDGSPPFNFFWRKNGTNITTLESPQWWGSSWLTLTNITFADAGNYSLFVTNSYGNVESSNVVLVVIPSVAPVITKHPRSLEVAAGVATWMSVASSGDPSPTHAWTKLGGTPPPPPPPGPPPPIGGQPHPRLVFTNVTTADGGIYFATAKNVAAEINSRDALLTVLPPISGLGSWWQGAEDVFVTNGLAFLAQGSAGFSILSVSNPSAPMLLGGYNTPGFASAVRVVGNWAYVADGAAGLQIFSVTNPFNPTLIGNYNTPYSATDLIVRSNLAFVADGNTGMLIINVSNAASPTLIGSYSTNISPSRIAVSGNFAYLTSLQQTIVTGGSNYWVGALVIVDISNPSLPFEAGRYAASFDRVDVHDGFAYATAGSGVLVIDVRNPAQPQIATSFNSYGSYTHGIPVSDIQAINDHIYLLGTSGGDMSLLVLDVRVPSEPIPIGYYTAPGQDYCLFVDANRVYVSGGDSNVKIIGTPFSTAPISPPSLTLTALLGMQLGIHGQRGLHYDIECSASPIGLPWQTLQTLLLTNNTATLPVTHSTSNAFFRLRQLD